MGHRPPSDYLWLGDWSLPIKPNLAAALRALRLPHLHRRLWVDAVCIDQNNVDERSRQVEYMRLVYKHAARVIVWLGLKTPGVEQAFAAASRLSQVVATLEHTGAEAARDGAVARGGYAGLDAEAVDAFMESMLDGVHPAAMQYLSELFDRPYWTRTWCIQEVVAASWAIVRVEELEISFAELMSITLFVTEWSRRSAMDKPLVLWHSIYLYRHPRTPVRPSEVPGSIGNFLSVLESARGFQATDVRDKIFAMLGICDEGLQPALALTKIEGPSDSGRAIRTLRRAISSFNDFMQRHGPDPRFGTPRALRPDYRKDAVSVYTDTTRFLMRKQPRMLDVLAHVQHNVDPSSGEYPSWVPKWFEPASCFTIRGAFLAGLCDGHFRYFAELHDSPWRGQPQRPQVLSLDGFRVDVVDRVSDVMEFGFADDERTMAAVERAWSHLFRFPMFAPDSPPYRNGEPLEVALCNALAVSPLGYITGSMTGNFAQGRWSSMMPADAMQEGRGVGPITQQCQQEIAAFLAYLSQGRPSEGNPSSAPATDAFARLLVAVRMYSLNRRAFLIRDGRIGIGPKVMEPGDEVVVLLGGKLPFVLRPRPDHHVFIGACYVRDNDVMWGVETEKVRFNKPGARPRCTFELR